jgi:hypothetical protein
MTRIHNDDIFNQVKSLNLPIGEYAVIGSGVMSAYDIRRHKDIDLVVTQDLYEELKNLGWRTKKIKPDFEVVIFGIAEASPKMITLDNYRPNIESLINEADVINGIAFTKLTDVIDFKRALSREKDINDILLIEDFLKKYPDPHTYFRAWTRC